MGLLRFIILVILGAGLSLALAAWRHVPDGPQPLFGRMQAYVSEAVSDLPELGTLSTQAERAKQALLAPPQTPAAETPVTPPVTAETPATGETPAISETRADQAPRMAPADGGEVAADTTREQVRTLLDARRRLQFWYEVALGTGFALFGGFLGGIGRRRRVAVAEYP